MKSLERYGEAIVEYEGVADITFPEESGTVYKGYFEARQMRTGGIAIGFVPLLDDDDYPSGSTTLNFYRPKFHGHDLDNWELTSTGQTSSVPKIGFFGAPNNVAEPALVFGSSGLRARRKGVTESGYFKARFLVSNLIWHLGHNVPNHSTFEADGLKVTVTPVDDYLETAASVKAIRGIAPTAVVLIESPDHRRRSLEEYVDFMNILISTFRLTTGNRIDWYFGEALAVPSARAVERIHKDAVTGPFSKTIRFSANIPHVGGLINAFFSDACKPIKQEESLSHRPVGDTGVGAMGLKRGRPVQPAVISPFASLNCCLGPAPLARRHSSYGSPASDHSLCAAPNPRLINRRVLP